MRDAFRQVFGEMRSRVLSRGQRAVFEAARGRQPAFSSHESVASVLAVLSDESPERWGEREALTRALLAEHRLGRHDLWAAVLVVAYYPLLCTLRRRLVFPALPREDLDQLVFSCFLEAARTLPLPTDRTALRLRQRTERAVFHVLRQEKRIELSRELIQARWREEPWEERQPLPEADGPRWALAAVFRAAEHCLDRPSLELLYRTMVEKERLRVYAAAVGAPGEAPERVYQRLKRQRSRAVRRLQQLVSAEPQKTTRVTKKIVPAALAEGLCCL